jgi:hypothetical protein
MVGGGAGFDGEHALPTAIAAKTRSLERTKKTSSIHAAALLQSG